MKGLKLEIKKEGVFKDFEGDKESECASIFMCFVHKINQEYQLEDRDKLDMMYRVGRIASEASGLDLKFFTSRMNRPWEEELGKALTFKGNYGKPIKAQKFNYAFAKYLKNTTHPEGEGLHPRYCKECKEYYYIHHNVYKWDAEISTEQKKFDVDSWFCDLIFHWMSLWLNIEITEQRVNDILFIFRHVAQETCDDCKVKEVSKRLEKGLKPGEFYPLPPN